MVLDYFDLNKRAKNFDTAIAKRAQVQGAYAAPPAPARVFHGPFFPEPTKEAPSEKSLSSDKELIGSISAQPMGERVPPSKQILLYTGAFIGVLLSSALNQFVSGSPVQIKITVITFVFSAFIALVIIPNVYEKLNPESPFIVQFGLFVQNGVFWNLILNTVAKVGGG
jgi:hypothetical protein